MDFNNGILQQKKLTKKEAFAKYTSENTQEIEFPLTKYERGVFVQCSCKSIEELPLDESQPIRITGKPKDIAEGICSKCKKHIIVYASIWVGE